MSKIKITILGTAAGVPTKQRAHSAIYLSYADAKEYVCMFDCGEGTQRQMLKMGLNLLKVQDLFITHWHGDHCLGIPGLIDTIGFEGGSGPINIYSPEVKRSKRCVNFINHTMGKVKVISYKAASSGNQMQSLLETERFQVTSIAVKHSIPTVAYAFLEKDKITIDSFKAEEFGLPKKGTIYKDLEAGKIIKVKDRQVMLSDVQTKHKGKKIVYSGDTQICDNLKKFSNGADLLIQDCTYFEKQEGKSYQHACFPEIVQMVKECNIKKTVLTHISRKYQDMESLKKMISGQDDMIIAQDFLVIDI